MIVLDATTKTITVRTSSSAVTSVVVNYGEQRSQPTFSSLVPVSSPASSQTSIASAGTTAVLSAPAANYQRNVVSIFITNVDSTLDQDITVILDVSTVEYVLSETVTLAPGESFQYGVGSGFFLSSAAASSSDSASETTNTDRLIECLLVEVRDLREDFRDFIEMIGA